MSIYTHGLCQLSNDMVTHTIISQLSARKISQIFFKFYLLFGYCLLFISRLVYLPFNQHTKTNKNSLEKKLLERPADPKIRLIANLTNNQFEWVSFFMVSCLPADSRHFFAWWNIDLDKHKTHTWLNRRRHFVSFAHQKKIPGNFTAKLKE